MAHLVTGYAGYEHIQSEDDGAFNAAFFGDGQNVMESGNQFEASILNNNTVRILDGDLLSYGRHIRIAPNTYEDLIVETGTAGKNRIDLICMTYQKNTTDGTEKAFLEVVKGTETAGAAAVPAYKNGNILEGATKNQMPLYKVIIEGVVLKGIVKMFTTIPTYKTLAAKYEKEFMDSCKSHLESLNVLDTMEEVEANTRENQLAGALAVKEGFAEVYENLGKVVANAFKKQLIVQSNVNLLDGSLPVNETRVVSLETATNSPVNTGTGLHTMQYTNGSYYTNIATLVHLDTGKVYRNRYHSATKQWHGWRDEYALNSDLENISITSYKDWLTYSASDEKSFIKQVVKKAISNGLPNGKEVRYLAVWSNNDYYLVDCWGLESTSIVGFTARSNKGRLIQGKFIVADDDFSWFKCYVSDSDLAPTTGNGTISRDTVNSGNSSCSWVRSGNVVTVNFKVASTAPIAMGLAIFGSLPAPQEEIYGMGRCYTNGEHYGFKVENSTTGSTGIITILSSSFDCSLPVYCSITYIARE